jgi:hypothetical protein
MSASSSKRWGATLSYRPIASPVSVFFDYNGFTNRTQALGTVWTENMFMGGIKINFGDPPNNLEPTTALPLILRSVVKF